MRRRPEKEATIEGRCLRAAVARGWLHRKMNGMGFRSWPDRLMVQPPTVRGPQLYVEFKRPGELPTVQQTRLHRTLRKRGAVVWVLDNLPDFLYNLTAFERKHAAKKSDRRR